MRILTHVSKNVSIHAAFDEVFALAEDRTHWQDWYVGLSHQEEIPDEESTGSYPHFKWLRVGIPFPLTQRVLEDRIDPGGAHWQVRSDGTGTCADEGSSSVILMLASDQSWTYSPDKGDTEIQVDVDCELPPELQIHPSLQQRIERLEAECLEQSLKNLKRLCEAA